MAVVGGHHDQRIGRVGGVQRGLHRVGQADRFIQRAVRVARMQGMVDATALDHQEKAVRVLLEHGDRAARHLRQAGLAAGAFRAVVFVLHVRRLEQAQQARRVRQVQRIELGGVPDVLSVGVFGRPFVNEIAPIDACARLLRIFRIGHAGGQEIPPPAAHRHGESVGGGKVDQLRREILATFGACRSRHRRVHLPVAFGQVAVRGRGRGVGDPCRADRAGAHARGGRQFQRAHQFLPAAGGAILPGRHLRHADEAGARLHAAHDRGHGAGRVGGLLIGFVGARQRAEGQLLEAEAIAFAIHALALAGHDVRGRDRGDAHAVAQEHDDILRPLAIGMRLGGSLRGLRRAAAEPPLRRLALRPLDGRYIDRGMCGRRRRRAGAGAQQRERDAEDEMAGDGWAMVHGDPRWARGTARARHDNR